VRPLWLALGCGAAFGVNALLLKIVPGTLPAGFADPLRQWPLYLMVIITPAGFLLNQNAFQAGTLIAPALAVITTVDPLVAMAAGAAFLHEKMAAAPVDLATEGLCLAVTTGGIIALAQRAPQVLQALDPPGTAASGRPAGSTASARPRAAAGHLTPARLAEMTVTPASPAASRREAPAGQPAALIASCRHAAHADHGQARPCCSTATRHTECRRIRSAA
jgi:hypothetical protein